MKVFVDTSGFIALEHRSDSRHTAAVKTYRGLLRDGAQLVTSDFVFDETVTLLKRRASSSVAVDWGRRMLASELFAMRSVDRALLEGSLSIFEQASDQDFSFTDCSSFAIMRGENISRAFAFDEDFTRFGFDQIPAKRSR